MVNSWTPILQQRKQQKKKQLEEETQSCQVRVLQKFQTKNFRAKSTELSFTPRSNGTRRAAREKKQCCNRGTRIEIEEACKQRIDQTSGGFRNKLRIKGVSSGHTSGARELGRSKEVAPWHSYAGSADSFHLVFATVHRPVFFLPSSRL